MRTVKMINQLRPGAYPFLKWTVRVRCGDGSFDYVLVPVNIRHDGSDIRAHQMLTVLGCTIRRNFA